jgi:hypothetical protein
MRRPFNALVAVGLVLAAAGSVQAQKTGKQPGQPSAAVIRSLSPEQTADFLKSIGIEFKQSQGTNGKTTYFDYTRNNYKIRLHLFETGKDLMVDALFPGVALQVLNQWNLKAKYTRAVLDRDKRGDFAAVEANFNLAGGVTLDAVKVFLQSFDEELAAFQRFLSGQAGEAAVYTELPNDRVETILKNANFEFKKTVNPDGLGMFEFTAHEQALRLHNFAGKDIMLDGHFPKISLEAANQWNLKKKFVRTVVYKIKDNEFTALEANLEVAGGVTDAIVRQFIVNFTEDIREFQAFIKNLNKKEEKQEK